MAQKTETQKEQINISQWCKEIIDGIGGMNDYEKYELVVWHEHERVAAAKWVIRCLANPDCMGSGDVLDAIKARREKVISEKTNKIAFEDIATAYPHEAHAQDPKRFCDFVRSKGNDLTDEEIIKSLEETK